MRFPGCADAELYAQAWLPEEDPGTVIVVSHGLAEHGGRYAEFAARMVARGWGVYAIDHRGHGRSSGRRANIERFAYVVSDLGTSSGACSASTPMPRCSCSGTAWAVRSRWHRPCATRAA